MERLNRRLVTGLLFGAPLLVWPFTAGAFEAPKLFLLITVALVLWGSRLLSGSLTPPDAPVSWVVCAFVASALVSTALSMHWPNSLWGAPDSLAGLGFIVGLATLFFAAQRVRGVSWSWAVIAASIVATGYGYAQLLDVDPVEWTRTASWCERTRPFSTLGHPNTLGGYLAMVAPIALTVGVAAWRGGQRARALGLLAAVLVESGLVVATMSRAAWLALAGGLFVAMLGVVRTGRARRLRSLGVGFGLAAVAVVAAAPTSLMSRAKTFFQAPTRRLIYEAALRIFIDHPLVGSGVDTFQLAFQQHRAPEYWAHEWGATPQRAHDEFLQLLATQGALGGLVALAGVVAVAGLARRAWRSPAPEARLMSAGLMGCLVAAAVHATFGFHVVATASLAAVVVGRLASLTAADSMAAEGGHAPPGRLRSALGRIPAPVRAGAGLCLVGGAAAVLVVMPLVASIATRRAERLEATRSPTATAAYLQATRWMPFSDTAWARLALAQQQDAVRGAGGPAPFHAAEASLRRAIRLSPENAYHQANLGRFLGRISPGADADERRAASMRAYDSALRLDPNNALLALDAIETAVAVGDLPGARRRAERLLGTYPNLGPAWSWLGFIARSQGETGEARAFLQNATGAEWHGDAAGRLTAFERLEAVLRAGGLTAQADEVRARRDAAATEPADAPPPGCGG